MPAGCAATTSGFFSSHVIRVPPHFGFISPTSALAKSVIVLCGCKNALGESSKNRKANDTFLHHCMQCSHYTIS